MKPQIAVLADLTYGDEKFIPEIGSRVDAQRWMRTTWAAFIDGKPVDFQPKDDTIAVPMAKRHIRALLATTQIPMHRRLLDACFLCSEWFTDSALTMNMIFQHLEMKQLFTTTADTGVKWSKTSHTTANVMFYDGESWQPGDTQRDFQGYEAVLPVGT